MTFFKRCTRLLHNLLHINQLEYKIAQHEERLQQLITQVNQQQRDLQEQFSTLQRSTIPTLETNFNKEILVQLETLKQRIEQKSTIIAPPAQRPKLAYISPLPPERSGISNYSAALLPILARYYDIEVIVAQPAVSDEWIRTYCPIRDVAWFKQHASSYARILYNFGNSPFHSHMFDLLRQHPGVVVLHDFYLSSVLAYDEKTGAAPWIWSDALYHSHGYAALQTRYGNIDQNEQGNEQGITLARERYPSNMAVLQHAIGIIVHSDYAKRIARQWYGPAMSGNDWVVIPHLKKRTRITPEHRLAARQQLGIHEHDFVVCSMGFIDPSKSHHRLLEAWLASRLANEPTCKLLFVGANHPGVYGQELLKEIANSKVDNQVQIVGWTDLTTFQLYLDAADIAVQLRSLSRGETSGAVLDCMSHGLATIINANGSMADLPDDATWKLPELFSTDELVFTLETLWQDEQRRHQLASAAYAFIQKQHQPNHCAERYQHAIETFYQSTAQSTTQTTTHTSQRLFQQRQILVDISSIARNDLKTGIERVVRAQLLAMIANPPSGWRIEPVYLSDQDGTWHYRYARSATCALLGMPSIPWLAHRPDDEIVIQANDVFYAPDFHPSGVIAAAQAGVYAKWREQGVSINILIHDLLPVLRPEFFPEGSNLTHAAWLHTITSYASRCICISQAVADELQLWLKNTTDITSTSTLPSIHVLHHGADIAASAPSQGLPENAQAVLEEIQAHPSFLMVGTIEPRKAYLQVLAGFEALWRDGHDVKLIIVGHEGWKPLPPDQRRTIPETVAQLRNHPELGKRLLWLEGISDEYLQKIYQASTCLLAASEGEGFGLPLIEAARYQLPIIARDLPVFREVAQHHAYYFEGNDGDDIQRAITSWLELHATGSAPSSSAITWQTWAQNTEKLIGVLV